MAKNIHAVITVTPDLKVANKYLCNMSFNFRGVADRIFASITFTPGAQYGSAWPTIESKTRTIVRDTTGKSLFVMQDSVEFSFCKNVTRDHSVDFFVLCSHDEFVESVGFRTVPEKDYTFSVSYIKKEPPKQRQSKDVKVEPKEQARAQDTKVTIPRGDFSREETPAYEHFTIDCSVENAKFNHLLSLDLNLAGRRVLEVGAGRGRLTGIWESLNCDIVSTEGRYINIEQNLADHPWRRNYVFRADVTIPNSHSAFGHFDIVFCYGLLYHVPDPAFVIKDLSYLCDDLFFIETMVSPADGPPLLNERGEYISADQGMYDRACTPTRSWFMKELGRHFDHVYATREQPYNTWYYPLEWPQPANKLCRSVFVASREKLASPLLTKKLPRKQSYCGFDRGEQGSNNSC